jgi:hypothetical protein
VAVFFVFGFGPGEPAVALIGEPCLLGDLAGELAFELLPPLIGEVAADFVSILIFRGLVGSWLAVGDFKFFGDFPRALDSWDTTALLRI